MRAALTEKGHTGKSPMLARALDVARVRESRWPVPPTGSAQRLGSIGLRRGRNRPMPQLSRRSLATALIINLAWGGCRQQPRDPQQAPNAVNSSAQLACREFEPIARDVDKGLLSDTEFRAGVRRVYDTAIATPSDVSRRAEALLTVATQGGTAQQWRQAFLDLAESCARVVKAAAP